MEEAEEGDAGVVVAGQFGGPVPEPFQPHGEDRFEQLDLGREVPEDGGDPDLRELGDLFGGGVRRLAEDLLGGSQDLSRLSRASARNSHCSPCYPARPA